MVWVEKSAFAIEEYIFARYYMYWNVYLHKTTRGFEAMLVAMWKRARELFDAGKDIHAVPAIQSFWTPKVPCIQQYLAIEEFTFLQQIQNWTGHWDRPLGDLARRFLNRERFAAIDQPPLDDPLSQNIQKWHDALLDLVRTRLEYNPPEMYCLKDKLRAKYTEPYYPEKESQEQGVSNAIRLIVEGEAEPVEISEKLRRLKPVTKEPLDRYRFYIPKDLEAKAKKLRQDWNWK
jgi:HD superfamily phosphohydrolase